MHLRASGWYAACIFRNFERAAFASSSARIQLYSLLTHSHLRSFSEVRRCFAPLQDRAFQKKLIVASSAEIQRKKVTIHFLNKFQSNCKLDDRERNQEGNDAECRLEPQE
jgi:hypothetical protein